MSTYTVEKLPDEPIVYSWLSETWKADELAAVAEDLLAIFDAADEPPFYISNVENVSLNLEEIITSASLVARGGGSVLHHPNIREYILVTKAKLLQLAAKGLGSDTFGNLPVKIFETEDEAFAYARARITEG